MSESKTEIVEKKEDKKMIYKVTPKYYGELDAENRTIKYKIELPGVESSGVELKVLPELWHLVAKRYENNHEVNYVLTKYFTYEVDPDSIDAKFTNGLLNFTIKLKDPLAEAVDITLD